VQTTLLVTGAVGEPAAKTVTITEAIEGDTKSGRRRTLAPTTVLGGSLMTTVTLENAAPL